MSQIGAHNLHTSCPYDGRLLYVSSGYFANRNYDAYVDTGIVPKRGMKYELVSQFEEDVEGWWMTVCGVYNPSFRIEYHRGFGSPAYSGVWVIDGFSGKPSSLTDVAHWTGTMNSDQELTMSLFAQHEKAGNATKYASTSSKTRIFSYKCYGSDGTLMQDFIPVRVGDQGAFFDKVSKNVFLSNGTDPLLCGPEI